MWPEGPDMVTIKRESFLKTYCLSFHRPGHEKATLYLPVKIWKEIAAWVNNDEQRWLKEERKPN